MMKNLDISVLLEYYGSVLTEKQREMVSYYYDNDLSLAEIAQNEGITRQGVRDTIKRAETQLFEMESQLGLVKKTRDSQKLLDEINGFCAKIREYNLRYNGSREIDGFAIEIEGLSGQLSEIC